jgi:ribosome biogenesis GTPase
MSDGGTVVARYRRHCLIEDSSGARVSCRLQGRSLSPVVGDRASFRLEADGIGILSEIGPRKSTLTRIDSRGRPELVAANLSQLVIVIAPDPTPDWFLLDRYLVAAELGRLAAVIAFNKIDLTESVPQQLDDYLTLGYPQCKVSASQAGGLIALEAAIGGKRSAMIGQSGVGKSSLLNALIGDELQAVGELSQKSRQGRHTTTTAMLYSLPGGTELIDSPGVRDFAPYIDDVRDVARGFREFEPYRRACRFQDCRHLAEPNCSVKAAVDEGKISARRYESFQRLHALTAEMLSGRY